MAAHLGTDHTELYVTPEEAQAVIPQIPALYDEPYADSSQIPTYLVSKLARRHVTVSLSGDAGDELFAGYNRYYWAPEIWRRLGRKPRLLRRAMAASLTALRPATWDGLFRLTTPLLPAALRYANPGDKLHKMASTLTARHPEEIYRELVSFWKNPQALVPGSREPVTALDGPEGWPDVHLVGGTARSVPREHKLLRPCQACRSGSGSRCGRRSRRPCAPTAVSIRDGRCQSRTS